MENELQILSSIEKNEYATQRDLAKSTGMSLGNVNLLIKRLAKKGLVKIERLNAKTIRYILTPQGIKEKAEATYNYIIYSYRFINDVNAKIDDIINTKKLNKDSIIILFGDKDEIYDLIRNRFEYRKMTQIDVQCIEVLLQKKLHKAIIIVWHPSFSETLKSTGIEYINVLDRI